MLTVKGSLRANRCHHCRKTQLKTKFRFLYLNSFFIKTSCATPPEFTNGIPNIWSPEHLFAAVINSCYMATFLAIAENFKVPFTNFECKTVCKLEMVDKKFQITEAVITPVVHLENNELQDKALRVLEKSKQNCLVTNSIKTEIIVVPKFL